MRLEIVRKDQIINKIKLIDNKRLWLVRCYCHDQWPHFFLSAAVFSSRIGGQITGLCLAVIFDLHFFVYFALNKIWQNLKFNLNLKLLELGVINYIN